MTGRVGRRLDLVDEAVSCGDAEVGAVVLDLLARQSLLAPEAAAGRVAAVWDLCSWPMSVLSRERWVSLFRLAGFTYDGEPAEPPSVTLRLFRGSDAAGAEGLCWSSNVDVARWLACRFEEGWVYVADVEPWRLLAFIAPAYEDQHVVDTAGVGIRVLEGPDVVAAVDQDALAARLDALVEGVDLGVGKTCPVQP